MDTKSKVLLAFLFLAILTSIYFTYERIIVKKDFEVTRSETSASTSATTTIQ